MGHTWIVLVYTHVHALVNAPLPLEAPQNCLEGPWAVFSVECSGACTFVCTGFAHCVVSGALLQKRHRPFVLCAGFCCRLALRTLRRLYSGLRLEAQIRPGLVSSDCACCYSP